MPATCDAAVKGAGVLAADVPQVAAIGRTLKLRSASSLQFHIVYFADNCSKDKTTKKLETKAMTTSSQCHTGRICVTLPIITRENTSLAIHVVQKITIIRVQKIGKFAV